MKSRTSKTLTLIPTFLLLLAAGTTGAQAQRNLGRYNHTFSYPNSTYTTGGVGLRNRRSGGIEISGLPAGAGIRAAYIYWAVITQGAPPANVGQLKVQRLAPLNPQSAVLNVRGALVTQVGITGNVPCEWAAYGDRITVYRGDILAVATGNGLYKVWPISNAASGNYMGEDPWLPGAANSPLWEGASIVMVAEVTAATTVSIYDGIAGNTFNSNPGVTYQLQLPAMTSAPVLFDEIGADGQTGMASRNSILGMSNERTFVNTGINFQVAGPPAPGQQCNDSDWNGNTATPVTELWDDAGHTVNVSPNTQFLNILIDNNNTPPGDCLTLVANVVQQQ